MELALILIPGLQFDETNSPLVCAKTKLLSDKTFTLSNFLMSILLIHSSNIIEFGVPLSDL